VELENNMAGMEEGKTDFVVRIKREQGKS